MNRMIWPASALALLAAGAANAGSTDYYIKIPPIKGESEAMEPGVEPDEIDNKAAAPARAKYGDITLKRGVVASTSGGNAETEFKVEKGEKANGNPDRALTARGSAANDGHKDWIELLSVREKSSARATGRRTYEPIVIRKRIDKSSPDRQQPTGPGDVAAPGKDPVAVGLLLPAVQKVREAAARTEAWPGCASGQKLSGVEIMEASTGRKGRILDATVSQCASEHVTFNFSKIEWD